MDLDIIHTNIKMAEALPPLIPGALAGVARAAVLNPAPSVAVPLVAEGAGHLDQSQVSTGVT